MTMGGPALVGRLGLVRYADQTPFVRALVGAEKHALTAITDFQAGNAAAANRQLETVQELLGIFTPDVGIKEAPRLARRAQTSVAALYEAKHARELLAHAQQYGMKHDGATIRDAEAAVTSIRFAGHDTIDRLPGATPAQLSIIGTVLAATT